ncbi:hypothetical protein EWH08_19730 [Sphingobium indicum]|uniref:Uncharacterized protein n=2 Tax=Sphingobium indicum TaxID=332055 RepID=I5BCR3_SPHIB|nr:hypothetical protein [Sphingobium indicum]APL94713.1 hypothetical protein SIDU_09435 [Sphingobium indicum B90A]KEZ00380.1 hypothetical protein AI27_04480 [Sphingomonas sp. BHC-A]NYI25019.1 hypothetical protein [Sphingobium indicum]RYL96477.1 hypothetical protein EWH08_19730 [Sphingobium indicum]
MESTVDVLAALKRKLSEELDHAIAKVAAIEAEMAAVEAALAAIPQIESVEKAATPPSGGRKMSVKAMVLDALERHFPQGASALDLLECFAKEYGRDDVARTSLSPQLTTLKNDGKIARDGMAWILVKHD